MGASAGWCWVQLPRLGGGITNWPANVEAQNQRDSLYGLSSGNGDPFSFKSGRSYGLQPSVKATAGWGAQVDTGISAAVNRLNAAETAQDAGGPLSAFSGADLAVRKNEVERQVQLEILDQQARDDSLQGARLFQMAGPARGAPRGAGSGGFEMVRNGNWDAALNIGADTFGLLGELPGLQQGLGKLNLSRPKAVSTICVNA